MPVRSTRFQAYFASPPGVLFTFPHGTGSLSVTREYLGWEMVLPDLTGLVSCRTQDTARYKDYFKYEAITSLADLPKSFFYNLESTRSPINPEE